MQFLMNALQLSQSDGQSVWPHVSRPGTSVIQFPWVYLYLTLTFYTLDQSKEKYKKASPVIFNSYD